MLPDWETLGKIATIASILGGIALVIQIAQWAIKNTKTNRWAKIIAWAIVGKSDESILAVTIEYALKLVIAIVIWAIIGAIVGVITIIVLTVVASTLGSVIYGTTEAIIQYGILGAIAGAILRGLLWPLVEFFISRIRKYSGEPGIKISCITKNFRPVHGWNIMPKSPLQFEFGLDLKNLGQEQAYLIDLTITNFHMGTTLLGSRDLETVLRDTDKPSGYDIIQFPHSIPNGSWNKSLRYEIQVELCEQNPQEFAKRLHELQNFEIELQYTYENLNNSRYTHKILIKDTFEGFKEQVIQNWLSRDQHALITLAKNI